LCKMPQPAFLLQGPMVPSFHYSRAGKYCKGNSSHYRPIVGGRD
jgi:hypothetical protein